MAKSEARHRADTNVLERSETDSSFLWSMKLDGIENIQRMDKDFFEQMLKAYRIILYKIIFADVIAANVKLIKGSYIFCKNKVDRLNLIVLN